MASSVPTDDFIEANFHLLADDDSLFDPQTLQEANTEQVQDVENIMEEVIAGESEEIMEENEAFIGPLQPGRHATVNEQILDDYASAEHRDSTKHQTKWAVNVFKGISVKI